MGTYSPIPQKICPYCMETFQPKHRKQVNCGKRRCRTKHMHNVVAGRAKKVRFSQKAAA